MTATPSGWYPDPQQTGAGSALERWWDGTTWTEYTRTAYTPPGQPTAPFPAPSPGGPPGRGRQTKLIAAVAAGAVLVGGVVTAVVLLGDDGDDPSAKKPAPTATALTTPSAPGDPGDTGPDQDAPPPGDAPPTAGPEQGSPTAAVDPTLGVSLPVPEGWMNLYATDRAYISTRPYTCDYSDSGTCIKAGAYTTEGDGKDPKAAAEKDIAANAETAYGDIAGHRQTKAQKVTVAGVPGYLVRWTVDAPKGPDGTVQSVAFPSPVTGTMTVLRLSFDNTADAPKLTVMDSIVSGVRTATPSNGV